MNNNKINKNQKEIPSKLSQHKTWLLIGISVVIVAVLFIVLYSPVKEALVGEAYTGGICKFDSATGYLITDCSVFRNQADCVANGDAGCKWVSVSGFEPIDACPGDPAKTAPGICGCGIADTDSDGDGTLDCIDGCPTNPNKIASGICGCGIPDSDSDWDGTPDCIDGCPGDPAKTAPGICGCGIVDTICGCGIADTDSDGDGILDCNEAATAAECPPVGEVDGVDGINILDVLALVNTIISS